MFPEKSVHESDPVKCSTHEILKIVIVSTALAWERIQTNDSEELNLHYNASFVLFWPTSTFFQDIFLIRVLSTLVLLLRSVIIKEKSYHISDVNLKKCV